MVASLKRVVILIVGWGFVLLGILGLFLPILQGVLFILIGLVILSTEYVWAHHLVRKLKKRFPGVARRSRGASVWAKVWLRRLGWRGASSARDDHRGV